MLGFTDFTQELIASCSRKVCTGPPENTLIEKHMVTKPQRGKLTGLRFMRPDTECAPVIYAEDMYEEYKNGRSLEALSSEICSAMSCLLDHPPSISADDLIIRSNEDAVRLRLLSKSRNRSALEGLAYVEVAGDLVLTADIWAGEFRAPVNEEMLEHEGISKEELFEMAFRNTAANGIVLRDLADMACSCIEGDPDCGDEAADCGMPVNLLELPPEQISADICSAYVITNSDLYWGAASLFCPGVIERIQEMIGDFYILPSSIHELLIVAAASGSDPANLARMVREANRTVVKDEEILSDDLYICESGKVRRLICGDPVYGAGSRVC